MRAEDWDERYAETQDEQVRGRVEGYLAQLERASSPSPAKKD